VCPIKGGLRWLVRALWRGPDCDCMRQPLDTHVMVLSKARWQINAYILLNLVSEILDRGGSSSVNHARDRRCSRMLQTDGRYDRMNSAHFD
jgi:hypothetical protein